MDTPSRSRERYWWQASKVVAGIIISFWLSFLADRHLGRWAGYPVFAVGFVFCCYLAVITSPSGSADKDQEA